MKAASCSSRTCGRTWAPKGQTPIHDSWDRRDRLSATSAVTVSPKRQRLGLYFDILDHNVRADDFERFITALLRRLGRLTLVMDRYSVHRSAAKTLRKRFGRRLLIEQCEELDGVDWDWQSADAAMGKARFGGIMSAQTPRIAAITARSAA